MLMQCDKGDWQLSMLLYWELSSTRVTCGRNLGAAAEASGASKAACWGEPERAPRVAAGRNVCLYVRLCHNTMSCRKHLQLLFCVFLCHTLSQKWFKNELEVYTNSLPP